ncbi:hypothetical protein GCM10009678_86430 [Actinomadura kijaniata]|uniref:Uncharacterized protein n=1 Tax=Actinomadura namibiensis TaxID=182080 RepID=A0A7W3QST2_ACTNM|nr:hypothetical protein [Actinomadura namibiensis]MBA8957703.1 hypothetical protein [Actinomadura namibiensis]
MATIKRSVSFDQDAWEMAKAAAARAGMSPSAWVSRAARRQAIKDGYQGGPVGAEADVEALALADETEAAAAEEWRAAG